MFQEKMLGEQDYNFLKCLIYEQEKMLERLIIEAVLENNFVIFVSLIQDYLNNINSEKTDSI